MKNEKGSTMLEVALVLPVLMIILMGIADVGRYTYACNLMPFLAREGARYASLEANRGTRPLDPERISAYVHSLAVGLSQESLRVETQVDAHQVGVKVNWIFQPAFNLVVGSPINVRGHASLRR